MSDQEGTKSETATADGKEVSAKAKRIAEVFAKKSLPPGKSALLAKMKAFGHNAQSLKDTPDHVPPPPKEKPKIGVTLRRTESAKKLTEEAEKQHAQMPSQAKANVDEEPSNHKEVESKAAKIGFAFKKKNPSNDPIPDAPADSKSPKVQEPIVQPEPKSEPEQIISSPPASPVVEGEPSETTGQVDAMEAIKLARDAMGSSHSANLDATVHSSSGQQATKALSPKILRKISSEANVRKGGGGLASMSKLFGTSEEGGGAFSIDVDSIPEDGEMKGDDTGTRSRSRTPVGGAMNGMSRFKKAAVKVKVAQAFSNEAMERVDTASRSPSRLSFRPSLKAGQQAMQDIERKQWLARKNQADAEARNAEIKQAKDRACKKTEEMNSAMSKLNSILNPNKQSPEHLQELQEKSDGVLKRIHDSLDKAALGDDAVFDFGDDDDDVGDSYFNEDEVSAHQKLALRGRDIIFRLSQHKPVRIRRAGDNEQDEHDEEEDGSVDNESKEGGEGESESENGGVGEEGKRQRFRSGMRFKQRDMNHSSQGVDADDEEQKRNSIFGEGGLSATMKWQGPITVDRLTDDAEEMANSRALSGQTSSYASLCSVLIIDGLGNVSANGWEEKFLSLSDAKLWSAAYFSVDAGTISTMGNAGRFTCVADLSSAGVSVVFEQCSHTSTGFCIAVRTLSAFTIKLAPKRFKALLEWGAVLSQAINELPSQVQIPTKLGHPDLSVHGGMYHARPSVAFGVSLRNDYNNFHHDLRNVVPGPPSVSDSDVSTIVQDRSWVDSYRKQKALRRGGGVPAN